MSINVKNNVNKIIADAFSGVGLHHGICFGDPDCRRVYRRLSNVSKSQTVFYQLIPNILELELGLLFSFKCRNMRHLLGFVRDP